MTNRCKRIKYVLGGAGAFGLLCYKHFEMDLESGAGRELTVTMTGSVIAYGYSF